MAKLNGFDWLLLAVLAWSTFSAFRKGIVRVLFSIGGLIAGLLLASWNYQAYAPRLLRWFKPLGTAQAVAFLLILAAVVVVSTLLGAIVHKAISAVGLGFVDRLAGALFGIARGLLIGVSVLMLVAAFAPGSQTISNSRLTPYFLAGAHAVCFFLPADFETQVNYGAVRLEHAPPNWIRSR